MGTSQFEKLLRWVMIISYWTLVSILFHHKWHGFYRKNKVVFRVQKTIRPENMLSLNDVRKSSKLSSSTWQTTLTQCPRENFKNLHSVFGAMKLHFWLHPTDLSYQTWWRKHRLKLEFNSYRHVWNSGLENNTAWHHSGYFSS